MHALATVRLAVQRGLGELSWLPSLPLDEWEKPDDKSGLVGLIYLSDNFDISPPVLSLLVLILDRVGERQTFTLTVVVYLGDAYFTTHWHDHSGVVEA